MTRFSGYVFCGECSQLIRQAKYTECGGVSCIKEGYFGHGPDCCPAHELLTSAGDDLPYGVLPEFVQHIEACQPEFDVIRSANGHIFWVDSDQQTVLALCMGLVMRK